MNSKTTIGDGKSLFEKNYKQASPHADKQKSGRYSFWRYYPAGKEVPMRRDHKRASGVRSNTAPKIPEKGSRLPKHVKRQGMSPLILSLAGVGNVMVGSWFKYKTLVFLPNYGASIVDGDRSTMTGTLMHRKRAN